ncbi:amidase [Marinobacter bohaiensis]|uniref:amidase n=1 Tax=Marinobacter bohaiensis TaxID=2201898 RepID=UPI000DACF938|nr:amidase [Marinobacter bohaiensis]
MHYHQMSSFALADGIRRQDFSAVEVLDHFLQRIERHNPDLNAIVVLRADDARRQAEAADAAAQRGEDWGLLHGVPMTIKETFEIKGWPTTAGHGKLRDHVSPRTAPAVQRLLDAGAIVLGKTNVPELAGDLQTFNSLYGTTHNPWDAARTPGGSSGGAAAALAAGLTPLELGSDIGGSIRTPSAFCGVYGLKTTYGVIPTRGHVPAAPGQCRKRDLGVAGPMGRHLEDLDRMLSLLVGADDMEAPGWQVHLPEAHCDKVTDLTVAAWPDDLYCPVDTEVRAGLQSVIDLLRAEGAQVDEQARPEQVSLKDNHDLYYTLLAATMGGGFDEAMREKLKEQAGSGDPADYRTRFARGATLSHADWMNLDEQRAQLQRRWRRFFERYDVLVCPVTNTQPFPHDQDTSALDRHLIINGRPQPYMDVTVWSGLAVLSGLPALSLPVGFTDSGLPLAVQLIGPAFGDRNLLRIGHLLARHLHPDGLPMARE